MMPLSDDMAKFLFKMGFVTLVIGVFLSDVIYPMPYGDYYYAGLTLYSGFALTALFWVVGSFYLYFRYNMIKGQKSIEK